MVFGRVSVTTLTSRIRVTGRQPETPLFNMYARQAAAMSRGVGRTDAQTKANCRIGSRASCRGISAEFLAWHDDFRQDWPCERGTRCVGYCPRHPRDSRLLLVEDSCNGRVGQQSEVALSWSGDHCLHRARYSYRPIQVRFESPGSSANPAIPHRGHLYRLCMLVRWEQAVQKMGRVAPIWVRTL